MPYYHRIISKTIPILINYTISRYVCQAIFKECKYLAIFIKIKFLFVKSSFWAFFIIIQHNLYTINKLCSYINANFIIVGLFL